MIGGIMMKPALIRLVKRSNRGDITDDHTDWLTATVSNPSIAAKNWYRVNSNNSLSYIIQFSGLLENYKKYNIVEFSNHHTFRIFTIDQDRSVMPKLRLEVG